MSGPLSPDFITEFIEMYRGFPCLWKIKSPEYMNRNLRNDAYKEMVNFCRKVIPDANKDFVTKKINSLRGAFRKEHKKVLASKSGMSTDDIYSPKLWYYNLLMFTADQEVSRCGRETETEDRNSDGEEHMQDENDTTEQEATEELEQSVENSVTEQQEVIEENGVSEEGGREKLRKNAPKRKYSSMQTKTNKKNVVRDDFYKAAMKTLNQTEDECDYFGKTIANKLRQMESKQKIFCEHIINTAVYKGLLGQLTEEATVNIPPIESSYNVPPQNSDLYQYSQLPSYSEPGRFIPLVPGLHPHTSRAETDSSGTTRFRINDTNFPPK